MRNEDKKIVNAYFSIMDLQKLLDTGEVVIQKSDYTVNARICHPIKPGKFLIKQRTDKNE